MGVARCGVQVHKRMMMRTVGPHCMELGEHAARSREEVGPCVLAFT